ncbi:MAG: hypothetical protein JO210_15680 [Acidobacteriaceae bacterium]|nr:hypothetical protein [Acidobacteriaceae bacterium]
MAKTGAVVAGAGLLVTIALIGLPLWAQTSETDSSNNAVAEGTTHPRLKAYSWVKPGPGREMVEATKELMARDPSKTLPIWTFFTESSRDFTGYTGVMVGRDPFSGGGSASVTTYIVPLIISTNTIGTSVSSKGVISTKPGRTTFNPTVADKACLASPNDVPLTLVQQSPILRPAKFNFGGTNVGTTQYVDAFQRANFWKVNDHDTFHVLLNPVKTLAPVVINVPAAKGLALSTSALGPPAFCARLGIVDIDWFDAYLDSTVIPALAAQGVNPSNFPIFLTHNLVTASPITNLGGCCFLGYHGYTGLPIQTYSPLDFDSTGLFSSAFQDTGTMSHEVAEWVNDPYDNNPTPPWGHTGQVAGCQGNLEVGDPLSGTNAPPIVMPNGFTYHLQELAFFSWFFGTPSIGIHGWFSNNATFLTDAGPPCQSSTSASSSASNHTELTK